MNQANATLTPASVGFAHASVYPADVKSLVVSEVTLPGALPLAGFPDDQINVKTFHFGLDRLDDLPGALVQGHERCFLTWIFDHKAIRRSIIDSNALDHYAEVFSSPGAARAGFSYYRELFGAAGLERMKERLA